MNLFEKLPQEAYRGEPHVVAFQEAVGAQLQKLAEARDDLLRQVRPETATWGLALFEKEYGIGPDTFQPIRQRLSRWRTKRQGQGTTTKELLRQMAERFSGGAAEVTEYAEDYLVAIYFSGTRGKVQGAELLERSIRELLPAHLDFRFDYRYTTWGEAGALTWGAAEVYTWDEMEVLTL